MEYKSEIINFEKEDAESKKRMLGSDKVNRYLQESYEEALRENELLKAKLEQAEKALDEVYKQDGYLFVFEALQAIRK